MSLAEHHQRVISGRARGPLAAIERGALRMAATVYGVGVAHRNRGFDDRRSATVRVDVPVISIGNITAGGTGKTPLAIWLCRELMVRCRRPAVISRGYKAPSGRRSDEMRVIMRHLPEMVCLSNPDRVAAAREAIEKHGADVLVLDDGFQHRRLVRDLDIVLIDATCPFGHGHLLPRGLLREPVESLRRADLVIVTRADQVAAESMRELLRRLTSKVLRKPVLRCVHKPAGLVDLDSGETANVNLPAERVLLFAAVGNPDAFVKTARQMGTEPVGCQWWPDHHNYVRKDIETLTRIVREHRATLLLTTEKDAVKLGELSAEWPVQVAALRVEIDFREEGRQVMGEQLDQVLAARLSPG